MEGSFPIDSPYLSIQWLEGLEVSSTFAVAGGILKIDPCQFKGPGFEGTLSGEILLQPWLPGSGLNLKGEGQIDPALLNLPPDKRRVAEAFLNRGKPLPFKVRGTIEEPLLSLF